LELDAPSRNGLRITRPAGAGCAAVAGDRTAKAPTAAATILKALHVDSQVCHIFFMNFPRKTNGLALIEPSSEPPYQGAAETGRPLPEGALGNDWDSIP
jgi:hypothetical protein